MNTTKESLTEIKNILKDIYKDYLKRNEPKKQELLAMLYRRYQESHVDIIETDVSKFITTALTIKIGFIFKDPEQYQIEGLEKALFTTLSTEEIQKFIKQLRSKLQNNQAILNSDLKEKAYEVIIKKEKIHIKNELDLSIDIFNTFVIFSLSCNLHFLDRLYLKKSTFTEEQWKRGYIHSHTPTMHKDTIKDYKGAFCLGEGALRKTIDSLRSKFDIYLWELFFVELDLTLSKESLEGTPYITIASLTTPRYPLLTHKKNNNILHKLPIATQAVAKLFLPYFLEHHTLTFNYISKSYSIVESPLECTIKISNTFIEWYNSIEDRELKRTILIFNMLEPHLIFKNNIYEQVLKTSEPIKINKDIKILDFKNKPVYVEILENTDLKNARILILNINVVFRIVYQILKVLNTTTLKSYEKSNSAFTI